MNRPRKRAVCKRPRQDPPPPPPRNKPEEPAEVEDDSESEEEAQGERGAREEEAEGSGGRRQRQLLTAGQELKDSGLRFKDTDEQYRYAGLIMKRFENTRFLDPNLLAQLGIVDDFFSLMEKGGFKREFWDIREPAYTRLTMEFLCTVKIVKELPDKPWVISFRLLGERYTRSQMQIVDYFYLKKGGVDLIEVDEDLWAKITGVETKDMRSTLIQHPAIRLMQRILSLSLLAKGESGSKATREELSILTHILKPGGTTRQNLVRRMIQYWVDVGGRTRQGIGKVTLGGYATHLAFCVGLDVDEFDMKRSSGPTSLDFNLLMDMHHIERGQTEFFWVIGARRLLLPITARLDLYDQSTFTLLNGEDPRRATPGAGTSDAPRDVPDSEEQPWGTQFDPATRMFLLNLRDSQEGTRKACERMERCQMQEIAEVKAFREEQRKENRQTANLLATLVATLVPDDKDDPPE